MIDALLLGSLRNRWTVLFLLALVGFLGVRELRRTPVDAIPDLSENQVIVYADWPGRSPQEVEDQITFPLSTRMQGLAGVRSVRGTSMFGFSLLTLVFEDGMDNYFARTRVLERLSSLADALPVDAIPRMGPDATGLGWIYQYYLDVDPAKSPSGGYDLGTLRSLQDWLIRYQLGSVPGVAEIAAIGGFVRQYQVEVSSLKMREAGVSLQEVLEAVGKSHLNVGGKVVEENGLEFVVRGVGLIRSAGDLERVILKVKEGVPVYLHQVGHVQMGGDFRRGTLDVNGREVVGGIVVMRNGENAKAVIDAVKERVDALQSSLPPGVTLKPFYDRSDLISRTINTLRHALTEEVILVTLAHLLFLAHFRSILIVTLPLPLSILISFLMMRLFGITSNIMSLSGIAIAIGVLVDAGIVMTEAVIREAQQAEHRKSAGGVRVPLTASEVWEVTLAASRQVARPVFFAMAIIILAFVPVFSLVGQEGKLFHPLAFTKTFAMVAATLLAVTLVPVLCTFLVRGPFHAENDNWLMRLLLRLYAPVLHWALRHRAAVLCGAGAILGAAVLLAFGLPGAVRRHWPGGEPGWARGIGSEFMPALNEGSLLFMPVLFPGTSLTEIKRIMAWQDRVVSETPEVLSAAGKLGRAETATDPAPVEMIETTILLKPQSEWRQGLSMDALVAELTEKLTQVPGYVPGFLQPIENRILMLATGIRAQVGVKLFGDNLERLQVKALELESLLKEIPGATGVAPSRVTGKPYLEIECDREAMARFGLQPASLLEVVEAGIGGKVVGTAIEGRQRVGIQVRLEQEERQDPERLGDILVATPAGPQIPLAQLATIRRVLGPNEIQSENGRLRSYVQANVQGRDLGGFVEEARQVVAQKLQLDPGMSVAWSGQYENQLRARRTLLGIVPVVLLIIFALLYYVYHDAAEAAHVILAVPFALSGGVFLQWALGYPFSVAVWVGYIALFGTAIQTGVVMVVYLEQALKQAQASKTGLFTEADLLAAVNDGARLRLRPKVMTAATVIASLLPVLWSQQPGSEVMKPLAAPVIGGMLSSLLHILVVTPVIFAWLRERELRRAKSR